MRGRPGVRRTGPVVARRVGSVRRTELPLPKVQLTARIHRQSVEIDPKRRSTCEVGNETASQCVFARMARFGRADDHLGSAGASASPIHPLAQAPHLFISDPIDILALDASILE